ncbi:MAG: EamA family transporter, partial [Acetobacteraceae bacterium]
FGLWLAVLSRVPVSAAYPMISIGFVIVALLGWAFLGETLTPTRVAGIAFICCGVLLVSRSA